MKINRSVLFEWGLPHSGSPENGVEVVRRKVVGSTPEGSQVYELIVKLQDKFYLSFYREGGQEDAWQDQYAVDFQEVFPMEITRTYYLTEGEVKSGNYTR